MEPIKLTENEIFYINQLHEQLNKTQLRLEGALMMILQSRGIRDDGKWNYDVNTHTLVEA